MSGGVVDGSGSSLFPLCKLLTLPLDLSQLGLHGELRHSLHRDAFQEHGSLWGLGQSQGWIIAAPTKRSLILLQAP